VPLRSEFLAGLGATTVAQTLTSITATASIAVCAPLSGDAKAIGTRLLTGAQAAVDASNQLAGTLARTFTVRTYDDQNTIANALVQASFATGDSSVLGVIGHVSNDATLQAINTYGPAQMPLIIPYGTDDRLTATQYRSVFRLPTKDSFEGTIFARTVASQLNPKTPYVFVQDADYGADVANGFINAMTSRKIDCKFAQFPYAGADFGKVVRTALATQPDYVFLAGAVADMGPIVAVLRAQGYSGPIGASQGFFDPATLKLGPAAAGMTVSSSMPDLRFAPSTVQNRQEFELHHGHMDAYAAFGYAAAQVLITAIQRSNAVARNAVVTAIAQGIPIETMVGSYTFTAFGDALQPQIYYYTVGNGAFAYLHQANPSTFMLK
jgi:ABC-type branched-subunit amino acid transport system substrate-binding protein